MSIKRKTDRRTTYTINLIKDSFIELIKKLPYSQITVAKLCRQAELSRSTFYLHFDSLTAVLNAVLDDAITYVPTGQSNADSLAKVPVDYLKQNESLIPVCQRIGNSAKYQQLLMDPDLSEYIIGRILAHERDKVIPSIQKKTSLSAKDAETIFLYMLHGSFAINQIHHFTKDQEWYHEVKLLNQFTDGGYQALKQANTND